MTVVGLLENLAIGNSLQTAVRFADDGGIAAKAEGQQFAADALERRGNIAIRNFLAGLRDKEVLAARLVP